VSRGWVEERNPASCIWMITEIMDLAPGQAAMRTKFMGKSVLLKGQMFDAIFYVMTPARLHS